MFFRLKFQFWNQNQTRPISSFISKKRRKEINDRKAKERKRTFRYPSEEELELGTEVYANTNKNPISKVFSWGNACYGALGNPDLLIPSKRHAKAKESIHHPIRVADLELSKVKDVATGFGFSLFAAKKQNSHLFGCGINNQGQIGYHEQVRNQPLQVLVKAVPIDLNLEKDDSVSRVECGQAHSLVLTKSRKVFSFGSNSFGQCGRPIIQDEDYFRSQVIHSVDIPEKVQDIECGIR